MPFEKPTQIGNLSKDVQNCGFVAAHLIAWAPQIRKWKHVFNVLLSFARINDNKQQKKTKVVFSFTLFKKCNALKVIYIFNTIGIVRTDDGQ